MSQKVQKTIEINAKVKTSLEDMSKTIRQLEDGLSKQKFDLGKTSGLSKLIKDYKEAKTELDELMQGDQIARADIKKAENLGDKVSKLYKKIATSFKELQGGNEEVFKNLFPSKFVTQVTKGTQAIDKFFQKLDAKGIKNTKVTDLTKEVQTLETELSQLKNRRIKVEIDVDKEKVSKELQRINKEFDNMRQNFKKKLFPDEEKDSEGRTNTQKLDSSVATWSNKLTQDREARKNLKVANLTEAQKTQITKLEGQLTDSAGSSLIESERKRLQALQAESRKRETIAKTPGARDTSRSRREYGGVADKELSAQIAASEKELQRLKAIADKIEDIKQQPQKAYDAAVKNLETRIKTDRINLEKAEKALAEHQSRREEEEKIATQKTEDFMSGKSTAEATQEEIEALKKLNQERQEAINLEKKLKQEEGFKSQESKDSAISKKESTIANKRREIEALNNEIKNLTNETNLDEFFQKLKELGVNTEGIEHTHEGLEQIKKDLKDLNTQTTEAIRKQLLELGYDSQEADKMVEALGKGMEELGDKDKDLKRAENEMENLKNQVLQFFSLTNSVQLFKRAVAGALNTVKELDATMTEAAVVTDFSVGDMWDKLPQYSAEAQKLGVSINGMYQATTLYYQQGLKTNEAMALGIETMKMGKIASMDSTEATKAMTAALRGFNMELNETSATRVNDVYSQLAAVTAADTNQIATAMEKTASIAAAANMEFETTAALLAQIIETTQEAPETAGTAMKTIIARFSEVKALQNQGEATGTDEEGESIDVNKIQTALKTVGISMDSFFAGTEGLDSILLKLAEKWDTLDFETQRYVATMAAGSRQQSRFIAMMSDYARTTELVSEAQNSAGASQRQFEKTQDSMEAKLQKLKNAWDQFLMGLSNNEILKGAVDFLTFVIESVNKLTDALSGGNGLIKSLISLTTVISGLKAGKNIIGAITGQGLEAAGERLGITTDVGKKDSENGGPQGLKTAVIRASEAKKQGAGFKGTMGAFFTSGENTQLLKEGAKVRTPVSKKGQEKLAKRQAQVDEKKKDFLERATGLEGNGELDVSKVEEAYDAIIQRGGDTKQAAEAANAAIEDMGGSMVELAGDTEAVSLGLQGSTLNLDSLGAAATGVGGILMLLSSAFEALGLEELAEPISIVAMAFTGLGSVMSLVSTVAPALGISFTTAGIQIGAAGATAAAGGAAAITAWFPLIAIIGAIIAAVMIVIALFKAAKDASDEGQIEKLNEQIEALSTAADEAKNKLQEMASAKEELDKLQDAFQGLTKGSKEWKQALIENNQKVLELLDTYPQLAEYVSKGINGELTIAEEGWEKMQDQQQVAYTSALNAKTAKIQQKEEQELEFETRDFLLEARKKQGEKQGPSTQSTTAVTTHSAADTTYAKTTQPSQPVQSTSRYITNDEMQAFAAAAAERGVSFSGGSGKEAFRQVFTDLRETGVIGEDVNFDTFYSQISNLGSSFDELANSAMATSLAEEARADSIAANVAQTSELVQSSKEFGMVAEEMGSQVFTDYDDRVVEVAEDYTTALSNESKPEYEDTLQEYADNQNMTLDEVKNQIKDGTLSKETIANTLAARDVDNQMKDVMEGTIKVLNKISVGKSKQEVAEIKSLMTDRGLGLGIKSIQNMPKTQEDMLAYLKKQGFSADDAKAMGYTKTDENGQIVGDLEAFSAAMLSNAQDASAAFENAFNNKNTYGMGEEFKKQIVALNDQLVQLGSTTGLTVSQTQALANSLAKITANGGDTEALLQQFPNLLKGLSGNDLDNAINILSSTDWTTQNGIESTMQALESLGVTIDDQLTQQVYVATKAIKKLDLEAMEKKLSNLQSLIDNVEEKRESGSKIYTKEERDALVSNGFGEGQFVRTDIDEYVFMGDTNDLLSSIDDYVSQILDEMRGDVETAVEQGRKFESLFQSDRKYAVGDGTKGSITGKELTAEQIIQRLVTGEIDTLGMGGTNNVGRATLVSLAHQTGVLDHVEGWEAEYSDWMIAETLKQAYTNTYGYGGVTLEQNEEKLSEINKETLTAEYARVAGTEEFWELYNEQNEKRRLIQNIEDTDTYFSMGLTKKQYGETHFGETDFGVISSRITDWREGSIKAEADFNYGKLLESIANDQNFQEKYKDDVVVEHAMRALATNLNIENAHEMDFETLYAQLKNYQFEVNAAELALDAYIQKEAGLDIAVQQATEDLKEQGSELVNDSKAVKNLVASYNESNKAMKTFQSVLNSQVDAFKNSRKRSEEYQAALSNITEAAKTVFGEDITSSFVEQNKDLFIQMAQGGDAGQAAYEALGKKYAMFYLEGIENELGMSADEAFKEITKYIPPDLEIGATVDVTEAIGNLIDLGISADQAARVMEGLGYDVVYKYGWKSYNKDTGELIAQGDLTQALSYAKRRWEVIGATIKKKGGATTPKGGGGGGGSKGGDINPYDRFHNKLKEINDLLRERERLERQYQRLTDRGLATAKEVAEINQKKVQNLKDELAKQKLVLEGRKEEVKAALKDNELMSKYIYVEEDKLGNSSIRINWAEIATVTDEDTRNKIDEFYGQIEGLLESVYETEEAILDAEDAIWEELQQGKDEYLDLENQVKEAIIKQRQEEIDKLTSINDSINDTNARIIDSMQSQIEQYRQNRDNQKAEEEILDKQRKIAYLQQDTSGANAAEILSLQKEIEESQENYTDQLIDQKISELQEQNNQAAEQRQRQIDIMQAQLDEYSNSSRIWNEVANLIQAGTSATENLISGSELETLLKSSSAFEGMSKIQRMDWLTQINNQIANALAWLSQGAYATMATGGKVIFTNKDKQTVTGTINDRGEVVTSNGSVYTDLSMDAYGNLTSSQTASEALEEGRRQQKEKESIQEEVNKAISEERMPFGIIPSDINETLAKGAKGDSVAAIQYALHRLGFTELGAIDGNFGTNTVDALKAFLIGRGVANPTGKFDAVAKAHFKEVGFKTGGLADFTGPAWLDGTKSKPEYVLNSDQTKAFFTLVDVLSSLQTKDSKEAQNNGDRTYDIDINVESIGSDYDVEQLANTIKHLINEDARYRNNNTINLMR